MKNAILSLVLLIVLGAAGEGVSAQPRTPGAERFVLTGLLVWSGQEGMAWLQEPDLTQNQIVALRIGESVGPWKLTRFLDNGVEMDGPAGKVLVPLHNASAAGPAVAGAPAGGPASPAPAGQSRARTAPQHDAPRVAAPAAPVAPTPGYVWESGRPPPNAGAFGEALNKARAERAQPQAGTAPAGNTPAGNTQAGGAKNQPREAGPAGSQAVQGQSTPSGAASSDGGTNQVIRFPVGGGKQGIRELFGHR